MPLTLPDSVLQRLKQAKRVVALTGGGMAAASKVPSFREAHTGEWAQYDVSELATVQAYLRNPRMVWEWYEHRRRTAEAAEPNAAHYALVDLEQHYPTFTLITQTIDGLHWRAGSRDLIELNGCLRRSRCYEAGHIISAWEDVGESPPRCPHCGSMLRPGVVMFGEGLPEWELRAARAAVEQCDVFVCVGDVGAIEPVSSFPFAAKRVGALLLSIDAENSIYTLLADHVIEQPLSEALPELVRLVVGEIGELDAAAFPIEP
ncbi:MAG TPA: Sir2 family NAD-dependent protein deacetylase [Kouleothrix sp.]|uniref:SIR2 family NAD-dependent protein deacylase n=1 Tax=Kouleothrix sp. TaxID=2779161 RepID=UPI002C41F2C6|nr:Sir2 family NAD-dependent protein deacetylase [Kouleothrix sp.]HRC76033.1 Sir2 family NAD-dependent protein deacetylase [Kouleothrix sp.]